MFAKISEISLSQYKSQNQKINISIVLLSSLQLICKFHQLFHSIAKEELFFFPVQDPIQDHTLLSLLSLCSSFNLQQFLSLSLLFMTLIILKSIEKYQYIYFEACSSIWICLMFPQYNLGYIFLAEILQKWFSLLSALY